MAELKRVMDQAVNAIPEAGTTIKHTDGDGARRNPCPVYRLVRSFV